MGTDEGPEILNWNATKFQNSHMIHVHLSIEENGSYKSSHSYKNTRTVKTGRSGKANLTAIALMHQIDIKTDLRSQMLLLKLSPQSGCTCQTGRNVSRNRIDAPKKSCTYERRPAQNVGNVYYNRVVMSAMRACSVWIWTTISVSAVPHQNQLN